MSHDVLDLFQSSHPVSHPAQSGDLSKETFLVDPTHQIQLRGGKCTGDPVLLKTTHPSSPASFPPFPPPSQEVETEIKKKKKRGKNIQTIKSQHQLNIKRGPGSVRRKMFHAFGGCGCGCGRCRMMEPGVQLTAKWRQMRV